MGLRHRLERQTAFVVLLFSLFGGCFDSPRPPPSPSDSPSISPPSSPSGSEPRVTLFQAMTGYRWCERLSSIFPLEYRFAPEGNYTYLEWGDPPEPGSRKNGTWWMEVVSPSHGVLFLDDWAAISLFYNESGAWELLGFGYQPCWGDPQSVPPIPDEWPPSGTPSSTFSNLTSHPWRTPTLLNQTARSTVRFRPNGTFEETFVTPGCSYLSLWSLFGYEVYRKEPAHGCGPTDLPAGKPQYRYGLSVDFRHGHLRLNTAVYAALNASMDQGIYWTNADYSDPSGVGPDVLIELRHNGNYRPQEARNLKVTLQPFFKSIVAHEVWVEVRYRWAGQDLSSFRYQASYGDRLLQHGQSAIVDIPLNLTSAEQRVEIRLEWFEKGDPRSKTLYFDVTL